MAQTISRTILKKHFQGPDIVKWSKNSDLKNLKKSDGRQWIFHCKKFFISGRLLWLFILAVHYSVSCVSGRIRQNLCDMGILL